LAGKGAGQARYLYYAVRWYFATSDVCLPLSKGSVDGFNRQTRETARDRSTWEAAVLKAKALTDTKKSGNIETATAVLLSFDTYSRSGAMVNLKEPGIMIHDKNVTIVFSPSTCDVTSKTGTQDDTIVVGEAPHRSWLSNVARVLKSYTPLVHQFSTSRQPNTQSVSNMERVLPDAQALTKSHTCYVAAEPPKMILMEKPSHTSWVVGIGHVGLARSYTKNMAGICVN
jgi:hypothetical protein